MRLHLPYHDFILAIDNISVNDFEQKVICDCYTVRMSEQEEPESFEREVSFAELQVLVGKFITMTCKHDPAETVQVPFHEWLEDASRSDIEIECAKIINKREGRIVYYNPTPQMIEDVFGKINNGFDTLLNIIGGQSQSKAS